MLLLMALGVPSIFTSMTSIHVDDLHLGVFLSKNLIDYDCVLIGTYIKSLRPEFIDYLHPILSYGHVVATTLTAEEKRTMRWNSLWSFLEPFTNKVWFAVFFVVADLCSCQHDVFA